MGGKGGGKGKKGQVSKDNKKTMEKLSKIDDDCKVWIGDLPKGLDWKKISDHFEKTCGVKPRIAHLMSYGKGVAAFKDVTEAAGAIAAVNGSTLGDKTITVDVWTKKEKKE